jgi:hypothetical protein
MKQYVVDELADGDCGKIKEYLDAHYGPCRVEGIYWVPMDGRMANAVQAAHGRCQPHVFAVYLGPGVLTCELLVRTLNRMRCDCMGYANPEQTASIIRFVDKLLLDLGVLC